MREKSENQTFVGAFSCILEEFFKDFFMANMYAIKSAQSHDGFSSRYKIGYGMKNGQQIGIISRKFSVIITYKKQLKLKIHTYAI